MVAVRLVWSNAKQFQMAFVQPGEACATQIYADAVHMEGEFEKRMEKLIYGRTLTVDTVLQRPQPVYSSPSFVSSVCATQCQELLFWVLYGSVQSLLLSHGHPNEGAVTFSMLSPDW
jgi:hypothetical protein